MSQPIVRKIGDKLRSLNDEVTTQPLPRKMQDLLRQLDRKDKGEPDPNPTCDPPKR